MKMASKKKINLIIEHNSSCIKLEILPNVEFLEVSKKQTNQSLISKQIAKQLLNMFEVSINNNEMPESFTLHYKKPSDELRSIGAEFTHIKGDGDCLYGAIIHQLFGYSIGSDKYKAAIISLRRDVVSTIRSNYSDFEISLKGSVYEKFEAMNKDVADIDQECALHLDEMLTVGFWGGGETVKAASQIHKVNILIMSEGEDSRFTFGFNKSFDRTLLIAFRLAGKRSSIRDHYDSVVRIEDTDIYDLSKCLSTTSYIIEDDSKNDSDIVLID